MKATKAAALIVLVLAALTTLFVGSASAWHVVGVKAHCDQSKPQTLHVQVKLSDAGPGTFHDNFGKRGSFGHVTTFNYKTDSFGNPYRVTVRWNTGERGEFGPVSLRKCGESATTTTSTTIQEEPTSTTTSTTTTQRCTESCETTTTTLPARVTTTTVPSTICHDTSIATIKRVIQGLCPTTTSVSPHASSTISLSPSSSAGAAPNSPPKTLPRTGSSTTPMLELGVCVLAAGAALVAGAKRRAT